MDTPVTTETKVENNSETSDKSSDNVKEVADGKSSDSNSTLENSFSNSLSPPDLSPIKSSDKLRGMQNQVSLVPNLNFNFNQFINNIPNFSGENPEINVGDFIDKIIEIRDFAGWQEAQCVFAIKLKCIGEAQKFIKSQPHLKNTQSFTELKEALHSRFSKTVDEAYHLQEFTMAKQLPRESNRAFLSRVLGLSYKCFAGQETIREKLLVQKCLQGLLPEVRKFVMPHSPITYKQIWDLAICQEKCADYDQAQTSVNTAQTSYTQPNELQEIKSLIQNVVSESDRKIADLSNQVQALLQVTQAQSGYSSQNYSRQSNRNNYNRFNGKKNILCFNCNQSGHFKRNCPQLLRQETQNQSGQLNC